MGFEGSVQVITTNFLTTGQVVAKLWRFSDVLRVAGVCCIGFLN